MVRGFVFGDTRLDFFEVRGFGNGVLGTGFSRFAVSGTGFRGSRFHVRGFEVRGFVVLGFRGSWFPLRGFAVFEVCGFRTGFPGSGFWVGVSSTGFLGRGFAVRCFIGLWFPVWAFTVRGYGYGLF